MGFSVRPASRWPATCAAKASGFSRGMTGFKRQAILADHSGKASRERVIMSDSHPC
jgi:hypothetical protein